MPTEGPTARFRNGLVPDGIESTGDAMDAHDLDAHDLDAHDLDDRMIESILSGRRPTGDRFDALAQFVHDVHTVAEGPVPMPSASLAAVLAAGFSTEKGDLLVTAASNVNGPAPQVSGLPKWRKRPNMLSGLFSGLVAKIAAGVVSGLVGVTAVGAAGALPGPAQSAVASVVNTVTPFNLPDGNPSASLGAAVTANPGTPGASVTATAGASDNKASATVGASTAGANASANAGTSTPSTAGAAKNAGNAAVGAAVTTPTIPTVPNIPGLPNLGSLPGVQVPSCVKDIVDVKTGQPKVPLSQISPQVVNCVKSLMTSSGAPIPAGVSQCVNSILGMITGVTPGSVPNIASLDVSKCVPVDVTKCMSSVMGMFQNFLPGFGLGFGGGAATGGTGAGAGGGFSIPGLSGIDLSGCVPFNLDACLSSIFSMAGNLPGVATGGVPGLGSGALPSVGSLNLAACVPFGSLPSIPGLGMLGSFLPR